MDFRAREILSSSCFLAFEAVDWWEVAIVAPRNFVAPSDIDLDQPSVSSIWWFFRIFFPSKTGVTHLSGHIMRSISLDSWSMVWTVSVCSSREPQMIERSLAYVLALWGAERVNLGVQDNLDFMVGGSLQMGKNFRPFFLAGIQSTSLRSTSSVVFSSPSYHAEWKKSGQRPWLVRISSFVMMAIPTGSWSLGCRRTYWSFLSLIPSMLMVPSSPVLPYFASSSQSMALLTVSSSLWYTDSSLPKVEQITTDSSPSWRKRCTEQWPDLAIFCSDDRFWTHINTNLLYSKW